MKKIILLGLVALFTIVACQQNDELVITEENTIAEDTKHSISLQSNKFVDENVIDIGIDDVEYVYLSIIYDDGLTESQKLKTRKCLSTNMNITFIERTSSYINGLEIWKCIIDDTEIPNASIIIRTSENDNQKPIFICNATIYLNGI